MDILSTRYDTMDEKTRIEKDIDMFKENHKKISQSNIDQRQNKIIELASQYFEDTI